MSVALQKLTKAKATLILDHPFFASIVCSMPFVEQPAVRTMGVDGKHIYYAPEFVESMTDRQVLFVLCHEAMHCVFSHFFRCEGRDHRLWNIAGDYVINEHLINDKIGDMPACGLHDTNLFNEGKGVTEVIYDLLLKNKKHGGKGEELQPGETGESMDNVMPEDKNVSQAERSAQEQDMKVRIAQAAQSARMQGKLSEGIGRLVAEALKPKVDWKEVLRQFVASKGKTDYTFARPKRRFAEADFYLPTSTGFTIGPIAVFSDFSGSIRDEEAAQWLAEIRAIVQDLQPERVMSGYFHHCVFAVETFEQGEEFAPAAKMETGGTAFSPIFAKIAELDFEPQCCVVLTDLQCSDFGPAPDYPVLWVTTDAEQAPFGDVVKMKA